MSSSEDRHPAKRRATVALGLALALALPACTVHPLYEKQGATALGAPASDIASARGRIGVSPANDRTAQIVRNALIFDLNGGRDPASPYLYEIRPTVTGTETVVSIQSGSGVPAASLYRITIAYQLVRISDSKVILSGTRFASAPFDRSEQLFAASRALLDARDVAGKEAAERVAIAISTAIARDLRTAPGAAG